MKKLILLLILQLILATTINAQQDRLPPVGFDALRNDTKHGKLNTIRYDSKTAGAARKAPGKRSANTYDLTTHRPRCICPKA